MVQQEIYKNKEEEGILSSKEEDEEIRKREEELKNKTLFSKSPKALEAILNNMRNEMIKNFYEMDIDGSRIRAWKARINIILSKMRHLSFDEAEKMYVGLQREVLSKEYELRDNLYAEGVELQDEKDDLRARITDLNLDLDKLEKIISINQVKIQEIDEVLNYKLALKNGKEIEKPRNLTKIVLEDYLKKSDRDIEHEKREIRNVIHNAYREHEQEEDKFKELDYNFLSLSNSIDIKYSQYTKQQQRIDTLRKTLDFVHHKYLNKTVVSAIKQIKENNKIDKRVIKLLDVKNRNSGYNYNRNNTYDHFVAQVIKQLENPTSLDISRGRNSQKEELEKVIADISSSARQYSGKRSEEIEKRREFYRNKKADDHGFF